MVTKKPVPANVRTCARTAADLISATLARGATTAIPLPSPEALAELRTIVQHNDSSGRAARVSAETAIEFLRGHGWVGKSKTALDALCVRTLGRRSYARA